MSDQKPASGLINAFRTFVIGAIVIGAGVTVVSSLEEPEPRPSVSRQDEPLDEPARRTELRTVIYARWFDAGQDGGPPEWVDVHVMGLREHIDWLHPLQRICST